MRARKPRASKILLWLGLAVMLSVVAGLIWFSTWVTGYLHSESFRRLAAAKTGDALDARVSYGPFRWTGSSVFAEECDAEGAEDSELESLAASELRADITWRALLHGVWRIERVEMLEFSASFLPPDVARSIPVTAAPAPSGLARFLPQKFEIGEVAAGSANLKFQISPGKEFLSAQNTRLTARSDSAGWEFSGVGGTLTAPLVGELGIADCRIRLQGDDVFLGDSHFTVGSTGKISVFGQWSNDSRLNLTWSQVDVARLLTADWKNRLSGTLAGSCVFQAADAGNVAGNAAGNDADNWKASGEFQLTEGQLQDFPLLDQLATFSNAPQFARLPIDLISGKFERTPGGMVITEFLLESKGLLRVESSRVVANANLTGTFRVGVGASALRWLPGNPVFTVANDGYLWTEMAVDGPLQDPREDLSARLVAAIKDAAVRKASDFISDAPAIPAIPTAAEKVFNRLLNAQP